MTTEAYVDDVFTLVQALAGEEITRSLMAPDADALGEVSLDVYVPGDQLRSAIAVQQALQLSVDAAAIFVDFSSRNEPDVSREYVEAILRDHIVELIIVDLATGSFRAHFKIDVRTANGRARLLALANATAAALSLFVPPAAIAVVILVVLQGVNEFLSSDATPRNQAELKTVDSSDIAVEGARVTISVTGP